MKKLFVLMMVLVTALSLAACGGRDTQEAGEMTTTEAEDWPYKNVTREQIQAINDVLTELEPLYNEAVTLAQKNGWEEDELTVKELNTVYMLIDVGKYGAANPSDFGDISKEDMDLFVEQYQIVLGAMPDLIARVSEIYEK